MRFEEVYGGPAESRLTQEEAALLLGVCARTFRRYINRYEDEGPDGLIDKRLSQISHRRAPVDEVMRLVEGHLIGVETGRTADVFSGFPKQLPAETMKKQRQRLLDENANLNTLYILKEQLHAWWESETVELMQARLEASGIPGFSNSRSGSHRYRIKTRCSMLRPDIHSQDRRRAKK